VAAVNIPANVVVPLLGETLIAPLINSTGSKLIDPDGDTVRELPLGTDKVQLPVTEACTVTTAPDTVGQLFNLTAL